MNLGCCYFFLFSWRQLAVWGRKEFGQECKLWTSKSQSYLKSDGPHQKFLLSKIQKQASQKMRCPRKKRQLKNPVRLTPMRQEEKHIFQHDAWSMFCTSWSICPGSGALLVMSAIKQMPYFPLSWTVAIIIHRLASTLFSSIEAYPQALLQHPQLQ